MIKLFIILSVLLFTPLVIAEEVDDLAQKLANPIASLISVPLQYNFDENYGAAHDGSKSFINVQPVIPISLTDDYNLISRTILPLVNNNDIPTGENDIGTGDVVQSFFFSPKKPTSGGLIWGVGPVLLLPTASEYFLGGDKWGVGPTFVGLMQEGPWTFGMLANHIWSYAGDDDRKDVNATFLQPFVSYITKTKTTFTLNTETTYDWESDQASVPLNVIVSQLLKVGNQPIQVGIGPRYWIDSPDGGPENWGVRAVFTMLFPK
jgi:hypothetical protein